MIGDRAYDSDPLDQRLRNSTVSDSSRLTSSIAAARIPRTVENSDVLPAAGKSSGSSPGSQLRRLVSRGNINESNFLGMAPTRLPRHTAEAYMRWLLVYEKHAAPSEKPGEEAATKPLCTKNLLL